MNPQRLKDVKQELGRRLASWRRMRGLTQDDVARWVHSTRSTVANVESGRQVVDRVFWTRCEALLSANGELVTGYDGYRRLEQQHRAEKEEATRRARWKVAGIAAAEGVGFAGTTDDAYVGMQQAIMLAARETSEHAMNAGAWAVSDLTIDQLREDAVQAARSFGLRTPAVAVDETRRVRDLAVAALERTRRPAQQHELYLITAQAVALLASASADLGLWTSAMRYARAADTYGEIIGHAGVRAYARGMQATVAYWTGRSEEAVRYALAAVDIAPSGIAQVRAQCVLARAWAHRGAGDEVRAALTAADDARCGEGDDVLHDVIGGEFGFTAAQQARCASTALLQVSSLEEATTAATEALQLAMTQDAAPWPTVVGEARVDLAACHVLSERLDAAQETLAPLWQTPPEWRRTGLLGRLSRVQQRLSADRWRHVPEARQLAERAESFTSVGPTPPALPSD